MEKPKTSVTKKSATLSSRNKKTIQRKSHDKAKNKPSSAPAPASQDTKSSKKKAMNMTGRRASAAPKSTPVNSQPMSPKEKHEKEQPPTDKDKKKMVSKEKDTVHKKREMEKKLEPTQENEEPKESESGMSVLVKDDKKPTKMDDGYEDFGPGCN